MLPMADVECVTSGKRGRRERCDGTRSFRVSPDRDIL
jgi:hypothetical protein